MSALQPQDVPFSTGQKLHAELYTKLIGLSGLGTSILLATVVPKNVGVL